MCLDTALDFFVYSLVPSGVYLSPGNASRRFGSPPARHARGKQNGPGHRTIHRTKNQRTGRGMRARNTRHVVRNIAVACTPLCPCVLMLPPFAFSIRVLALLRLRIDRHGKKWTIGWPGHRQRPVMTKNSMPTIRRQLPFRSVSCLSDSARCPLHWKSWQAPAPATDTLELVCKRKRHLSRRR